MNPTADDIRTLAAAQPTTIFERVAARIRVSVGSWNGSSDPREVTLFHVLKYPDAFDLPSLRVVNDPVLHPRYRDGEFVLYLDDKWQLQPQLP